VVAVAVELHGELVLWPTTVDEAAAVELVGLREFEIVVLQELATVVVGMPLKRVCRVGRGGGFA
jgi:hypothetical protein